MNPFKWLVKLFLNYILLLIGKKRILNLILSPLEKESLDLVNKNSLYKNGWSKSWTLKQSVDRQGNPVPWLNLSFNHFFDIWDLSKISLLEIGGGNSSLFFSGKCLKHVVIEDNLDWYEKIKNHLAADIILGEFVLSQINDRFDLVIIDNIGHKRKDVIYPASKCLTDNGALIVDDSERDEYQSEIKKLENDGFKRLDIWGLGIGLSYEKCTTILYRKDCVLGI